VHVTFTFTKCNTVLVKLLIFSCSWFSAVYMKKEIKNTFIVLFTMISWIDRNNAFSCQRDLSKNGQVSKDTKSSRRNLAEKSDWIQTGWKMIKLTVFWKAFWRQATLKIGKHIFTVQVKNQRNFAKCNEMLIKTHPITPVRLVSFLAVLKVQRKALYR